MLEFRQIIFNLRVKNDLTQSEFASKLDISTASVAMWESGKRFPSRKMLCRIADTFHVPATDLIGSDMDSTEYGYFRFEFPENNDEKMVKELLDRNPSEPLSVEEEEEGYKVFLNYAAKAFHQYSSPAPQDEVDLLVAYRKAPDNVKQAIRTLLGLS